MTAEPHVVVVGGGLHGCSAALHLAQRGQRVVLLERRRLIEWLFEPLFGLQHRL